MEIRIDSHLVRQTEISRLMVIDLVRLMVKRLVRQMEILKHLEIDLEILMDSRMVI